MEYFAPASAKEAVKLLASTKGKAHIMAGGTDLLVEDAALKKAWPGVVEAANLIGSTQIQGRATIAGNLCNASPAADSVPAMAAAGAKAVVIGPKATRKVAVEKLLKGPGKNALKKGELVESIEIPEKKKRMGDAYLRFIPRTEMDIAVVGAASALRWTPRASARPPAWRWARSRPPSSGVPRPPGARRHHAGRRRARCAGRLLGGSKPDRRQARHNRVPQHRSRACWPAVPPSSRDRAKENK
jgi:hypothetical protein